MAHKKKNDAKDGGTSGLTVRSLIHILEREGVLDRTIYEGGRPVMSVAVLTGGDELPKSDEGVRIVFNTRAGE